jgi:hypothetical protein
MLRGWLVRLPNARPSQTRKIRYLPSNGVEVEAFNGKSSECKVKTVDSTKLENKAIIKIPEKLCQELDIDKGELVRVKPVLN